MPGDVLCGRNLLRSPIVQEFHKNVSISALLKGYGFLQRYMLMVLLISIYIILHIVS